LRETRLHHLHGLLDIAIGRLAVADILPNGKSSGTGSFTAPLLLFGRGFTKAAVAELTRSIQKDLSF
jgi:hypothetical protein